MNSVNKYREDRGGEPVQSEILIDSEKTYNKPDEWNTGECAGGVSSSERKEKAEYKEERDEGIGRQAIERSDGGTALFHKEHWIWASVCLRRGCGLVSLFPAHTHIQTCIFSELSIKSN